MRAVLRVLLRWALVSVVAFAGPLTKEQASGLTGRWSSTSSRVLTAKEVDNVIARIANGTFDGVQFRILPFDPIKAIDAIAAHTIGTRLDLMILLVDYRNGQWVGYSYETSPQRDLAPVLMDRLLGVAEVVPGSNGTVLFLRWRVQDDSGIWTATTNIVEGSMNMTEIEPAMGMEDHIVASFQLKKDLAPFDVREAAKQVTADNATLAARIAKKASSGAAVFFRTLDFISILAVCSAVASYPIVAQSPKPRGLCQ